MLHKEGSFWFRYTLTTLDHFVQTVVVTKLQQNVAIIAVLKEMLVFANVLVFEGSVDLDFGLKLFVVERGVTCDG